MYKPIKRVDQLQCQVASVGDVNKLYYLFSNTLRFPEAWPPTDKKSYYGGGVYAGNMWLKWVSLNTKAYAMTDKPARFMYLGAMPTDYDKSQRVMEARGITTKFGGAATVADETGVEREWGRSFNIVDSPFKEVNLFVVKFTPFVFPSLTTTPEARSLEEHHEIMRGRLDAVGGGPLGVRYVREIELGVKDLKRDAKEWQRLLDPIKPKGSLWRIGKGPALRLTAYEDTPIRSISIKVRSLRNAKRFLKMSGLLGEADEGWVSLNRGSVNNLDIRFVK